MMGLTRPALVGIFNLEANKDLAILSSNDKLGLRTLSGIAESLIWGAAFRSLLNFPVLGIFLDSLSNANLLKRVTLFLLSRNLASISFLDKALRKTLNPITPPASTS